MPKQILFSKEARSKLLTGINKAANAVTATLGYNGKYAIISKQHGKPQFSRDGVTVAREIVLSDAIENTGSLIIMEVAAKTVADVGDGTTTATLLCQKIIEYGFSELDNNVNPVDLVNGIDKAVSKICESLMLISAPIDQLSEKLKDVSSIAANNDIEMGGLIAEAYNKVGKDGTVTIEESRSFDTRIEVVSGYEFNKGYISQYFINAPALMCELHKPYILIYDSTISAMTGELVPLLETVNKTGRPLFIIAEDVNSKAIEGLLINHSKNYNSQGREGMISCAVKSPYMGDLRNDILGDIAAATHAKIISKEKGDKLSRVQLNQLGEAQKIVIGREYTIIIGGAGTQKDIDGRKGDAILKLNESTKEYDKIKQEERISKLSGGIGVIYIGAQTDTELKQRKEKADDAIRATKAALAEGVVAGGGTALIRCIDSLGEIECNSHGEKSGIDVIRKAISQPLVKIAENGGHNGGEVFDKVMYMKGDNGYNAEKNKFENLMDAGVIDPVRCVRVALQNASVVAKMVLRSEPLLVEI